MEAVGKFEFNRKDLIGHGAFAVVFRGRHREKRDLEVAIKCINKKNLIKSQSLLGKEIKILKELKHENIVGLLDYQEIGGCVYLVMEYCNGGDLAEYLHLRGTLSEDTIRVFLQQIARAMKVLQSKGILHRDVKPQNILLCHPEGRRSSPNTTCIKIADFGFARHLQTNTMAATLCGSPMYMAPEVIMSQNYDAKADLWSIGTVAYQCLTGKAPFYASTPQELRLFYESNRNPIPSIPQETSSNLRHLLLGLLQRNHKERMNFDEFFHHPFLALSPSPKKSSPVPMLPSYPSSGSGSSCSGSSTSHLASPQHSDGELQQVKPKTLPSPTLPKQAAKQDSSNGSSYTEDFVMVPAHLANEYTCEMGDGSLLEGSLIYSGTSVQSERDVSLADRTSPSVNKPRSKPVEFGGSNYHQSVPIPVPTQIHNYQRIEHNLQPAGLHGSTRATLYCASSGGGRSPGGASAGNQTCPSPVLRSPRQELGGAQPPQSSPQAGSTPMSFEANSPFSTRTGMQHSSTCRHKALPSVPSRTRTVPNLRVHGSSPGSQAVLIRTQENRKGPFKRSLSAGRLSDMLLKAAFGTQLPEGAVTAPPSGYLRVLEGSHSPTPLVFTVGTPSRGNTPPDARMFPESPSYMSSNWLLSSHFLQRRPRRQSDGEAMDASPQSAPEFHPPEFQEDMLMEQVHTDTLSDLYFTLAFVHCIMEVASFKDPGLGASTSPDVSFLEQSLVADQISLLSREWSHAEQLVLYMKAEEFLSSALHTARENIQQGQLVPSATVKQVIRKLNELYKTCVTLCRSLNAQLQSFLLGKQKLMDRFDGITAEKLIYSHTVHMVQSAALDEMFHSGAESVQHYQKALVLMEGLSRILTQQQDVSSVEKCKQCIERRLLTLQTTVSSVP